MADENLEKKIMMREINKEQNGIRGISRNGDYVFIPYNSIKYVSNYMVTLYEEKPKK